MGQLLNYITQNFTHVAPILVAGAFALVIILDRLHVIAHDYRFPYAEPFFEKIRYLVLGDRIAEAIAFCEQIAHKPVVRVVREALLRAHQPEALLEHGIEIAVADIAKRVQERTQLLATIGNVATLLGLLGTILGLVQAFEAVGAAGSAERAALLSRGIGVAMHATMLGLVVAIPCLVAYGYLANRSNQLLAETDLMALRMLDLLKQRQYATEVATPDSPQNPMGPGGTRLTRSLRSRGY